MKLRYGEGGLVPAVVQDSVTGEVLMLAWVNEESLARTVETGYAHYWSRSRGKLWKKGEESGNVQKVVSIQTDCDRDALLIRVEQTGVACHTGEPSCFFEKVHGDPSGTSAIIPDLKRVIDGRRDNPKEGSYTTALMADENNMLKKIIEEAGEFALAAKDGDVEEMAWELADLIYHVMVAASKTGLPMDEVYAKLSERRK
ncbi:MAG: bifunctional phosphoribosyl-AMP cyclohydrolase/phosphoribosyl-ATP diphosphatase HisIE [Thermoplasmatales archaeon]|nr:bifunctional phosphoribosyl-AMP cyclohydrolase/phosphoribosyl-ATP diphosphatase HisIE [Thermoplasmatales archaeon]